MELYDAVAVTQLSAQLGYDIAQNQVAKNIRAIQKCENDTAYVAMDDNEVVGWIHIFYTSRIETTSFCEIGGLIVDERYRGKGIGKLLVEKAKSWTISKRCKDLRVRTNVKRSDTHKFYEAAGFEEVKQQKIFAMHL